MKKILLATSIVAPSVMSTVSCQKSETIRNEIKTYTYIDFLKLSSNNNQLILIENDLSATQVFNNYYIYDKFIQTESLESDWADNINVLKISSIFNKKFFEKKFLVYVGGENTKFFSLNNGGILAKTQIPFDINQNNQVIWSNSEHLSLIEKFPENKLPGELINYLNHSINELYLAFDRKDYVKVLNFINKSTMENNS
ncbi:hypothetical protein [Mycoplasma zalophidermidis]|uniref:Lipoprotein n=1 Tax=Mycoplasma zalophidermidis TaxID=398174 RepID=A0ABS6DS89_9MOLU|nr:hypothetical protein [Mycoplasma zalophidermidis]MBU4690024.1 hypothetical protein [Mycoplasma zalophidermidis]MBU4693304.1 hypothetical protein [Mycoplasma zalophidermidis]MCR8966401.1 hypothetical protein [Mycoplasma zalophidermidis]